MAIATDLVLLKELQRQGINPADVDFDQDYAPRNLGKRHSPYAKFYRGLSGSAGGKQWMVVSGLPMVDADGVKCEPKWIQTGYTYYTKANVFDALVNDIPGRVALTCKNDQPDGRRRNDRLVYIPQLFLSGIEVPRPSAVLLPVDPLNPNYLENTIEWDYGICKRRLRQIEGSILGSWVFPANPNGEVRIKYNQVGDYRLKLGRYATDNDTEIIPASAFITDEFGQPRQYPFTVSDSATYNPDADPETTSVDGNVSRVVTSEAWATIIGGLGTASSDAALDLDMTIWASTTTNEFKRVYRWIILFDASGLPDTASISAATLSLYGEGKIDDLSAAPTINIYASTPASNTALVAADYGQLGSTAFSDTAITYANWQSGTPGNPNEYVLNASGIAAISLTGVSKFGVRNANYDVLGSQPPWVSNAYCYFLAWSAEKGTGYKPKLVVTYNEAARGWWSK